MKKLLLISVFLLSAFSHAGEWGEFTGGPDTTWLEDNRSMLLINDFKYVGPDATTWISPKGSIVDGASIPKFAWSIIGGPFEGAYRKASVIHDVACDQRLKSWQAVHRAFYTGMLAAGTDPLKAKIMYAAVYHFGPRWGVEKLYKFSSISAPRLGDKMYRLQVEGGSGTEVVLVNSGTKTKKYTGWFGMQKMEEIEGAIIEVRQVQPDYSEVAFKKMQDQISQGDLSLEEIELLPVED
jgi:hypothetical protein